jgi:hypothetical protein
MRKIIGLLMVALTLDFFLPVDCLAYLDLGTGSYILQVAVAAAVAAFFAIRQWWLNIRSLFLRILTMRRRDGKHNEPK